MPCMERSVAPALDGKIKNLRQRSLPAHQSRAELVLRSKTYQRRFEKLCFRIDAGLLPGDHGEFRGHSIRQSCLLHSTDRPVRFRPIKREFVSSSGHGCQFLWFGNCTNVNKNPWRSVQSIGGLCPGRSPDIAGPESTPTISQTRQMKPVTLIIWPDAGAILAGKRMTPQL